MVGRLRSAAKAIELGYAIELDQGRSGRARDWRIVGIPAEVCEIFSKRSDQIAEYLEEMGYTGYRARNIAARHNRPIKRGTGTDQLMPRWIGELEAHGWSIDRLVASLDHARRQCRGLAPPVDRSARSTGWRPSCWTPRASSWPAGRCSTGPGWWPRSPPASTATTPASWTGSSTGSSASELVVPLIGIAGGTATSPTPPPPSSPPNTPSPTPSNG